MRIRAYCYEAAMHCISCTQTRVFCTNDQHPHASKPGSLDQHGVPHNAVDREGNLVHPVFSIDELGPDERCDDCFCPLEQ